MKFPRQMPGVKRRYFGVRLASGKLEQQRVSQLTGVRSPELQIETNGPQGPKIFRFSAEGGTSEGWLGDVLDFVWENFGPDGGDPPDRPGGGGGGGAPSGNPPACQNGGSCPPCCCTQGQSCSSSPDGTCSCS